MASLIKTFSISLASILFGSTLLAATTAYAAVPSLDGTTIASVPTDASALVAKDGNKGERKDRDHHKRFCMRLDKVLERLVAQNVITKDQAMKIAAAFDCTQDRTNTTAPAAPTTTKPDAQ